MKIKVSQIKKSIYVSRFLIAPLFLMSMSLDVEKMATDLRQTSDLSKIKDWIDRSKGPKSLEDPEDQIVYDYLQANQWLSTRSEPNIIKALTAFKRLYTQNHFVSFYAGLKLFEILKENVTLQESFKTEIGEAAVEVILDDLAIKASNNYEKVIVYQYQFEHYLQTQQIKKSQIKLKVLKKKFAPFLDEKLRLTFELKLAPHLKNRQKQICKIKKIFYSRYPSDPLANDFYDNLSSPMCPFEAVDFKARLKTLYFLGQFEFIEKDIELLSSSAQLSYLTESEKIILIAEQKIRMGESANALELLSKIKSQPSVWLYEVQALAYSRSTQFDKAAQTYQKLYGLYSQSNQKAGALFDKAFVYYQSGQFDLAQKNFEILIKKFPKSNWASGSNWLLSWSYFLAGNNNKAIEKLSLITTTSDGLEKQRALYWYARLLQKLGLHPAAEHIWYHLGQGKGDIYNYYSLLADQQIDKANITRGYSKPMAVLIPQTYAYCQFKSCLDPLVTDQPFDKVLIDIANWQVDPQHKNINMTLSQDQKESETTRYPSSIGFSAYKSNLKNNLEEQKIIDQIRFLFAIHEQEFGEKSIKLYYQNLKNMDLKIKLLQTFEELKYFHLSARFAELLIGQAKNYEQFKQLLQLSMPKAYEPAVQAASKDFQVEPSFLWAIMRTESFFNFKAESPVHAKGLMQLMPQTAEKISSLINYKLENSETDLFNSDTNIYLGAGYLARLLKQFNGNLALTAAAYNAGPHRVQTWLSRFGYFDQDYFIENIPFQETRNYVRKVISAYSHYSKTQPQLIYQIRVSESIRQPVEKENWNPIK